MTVYALAGGSFISIGVIIVLLFAFVSLTPDRQREREAAPK
jgi:hypothetical protein